MATLKNEYGDPYECPYKSQRCHSDCLAFVDDVEEGALPWEHCLRLVGDTSLWYAMTEDNHVMVYSCQ